MLAHLSYMEGKVAAENAMGQKNKANYNAVPACVYTEPEIATVGLTEQEAKARGINLNQDALLSERTEGQ